MKKYIIIIASSIMVFSSCLKENPPFDNNEIIDTEEGLVSSTSGVFSGLASGQYYGADYFHLMNCHSGLITSGKSSDIGTISSLNISPNMNYLDNVWEQSYKVIGRANTILDVWSQKSDLSDMDHNQIAQNYFVRAFTYFNLVRAWGKIPIKINTPNMDDLYTGRAPRGKVYAQIIADADSAKVHFMKANGVSSSGRPNEDVVNMLLAKVYMTLAYANEDNSELNQDDVFQYIEGLSQSDCWGNAKIEAELADGGGYELLPNYVDLWGETKYNPEIASVGHAPTNSSVFDTNIPENSNSKESIFEIQYNTQEPFSGKVWNISDSYAGKGGFSRMNINPQVVDQFIYANMEHNGYDDKKDIIGVIGGDSRYSATFGLFYNTLYPDGKDPAKKYKTVYPIAKVAGNPKGFPIVKKYSMKNLENTTDASNQNMIIYRYASLKLMMAEIALHEGDVGGKSALVHVNDVLERARTGKGGDGVLPIDLASIDEDELYNQYRYELLGEGEDWFLNRRRGYAKFKSSVLDFNNTPNDYVEFDGTTSVTIDHSNDKLVIKLKEDIGTSMLLPIPLTEINTNQHIQITDQNVGY